MILLSFLKRERKRSIGSIQSWDIERKEFDLLFKEQRDYHGRFKVYFRMSVAQFDALLAILEPHTKKKTTKFCELGVQGQCFVLRDEVDQLVRCHSGFWLLLVRWLWIVKAPLKMLATNAKNAENRTRSKFFWRTKVSEAVCKRDWHNVKSYLLFNVQKFWTQCVMTFTSKNL